MDHRIHSTNLYPVDSAIGYLILIHWKVIYPLDSAFQPLRNRRLYFIFIYCVQNLTAWHRLSVRLLQEAITVIFFPCKRKFYWKSNNSTNKECCIAVVAWLLPPLGQLFFLRGASVELSVLMLHRRRAIICYAFGVAWLNSRGMGLF